MTTFHTFDIDNVPAPSDVELAAADARSLWPADIAEITPDKVFYRFCTGFGVTTDREMFHKFCIRQRLGRWTWDILAYLWQEFYTWGRDAIIAAEDARDLADTCADALI